MGYKRTVGRKRSASGNAAVVVGYLRVSSEEQSLSPEAQRAALERWCKTNGATLAAVFEDRGVSGGAELDKRPGLLAALDALTEHKAGVLLVAKRDRLARDVMVAAMVERLAMKSGARVLAADGTGNGDGAEAQLLRGMVDLFAQYERALIRARTRAALAVKKSRGERTGQVPLGYKVAGDGKMLEPEPEEQRVIARMKELRAEGLTIAEIAARLNAEGPAARGSRWHPTTVSRLLRRRGAR